MYPYSHTNPMPYYVPTSDHNDNDPRPKNIPSQMKMDPNPIPLNSPYQPWPYAPNYAYPAPLDYHGCCNHGYFGGAPYGFRPLYPNYPPPQLHGHGFYPPFSGAYPAYSSPPSHYSVEQPRYDYDKNNHAPTHHCCGCKYLEDEKKPSIERQLDKKMSESLVPFLLKDSPYPVMWVPPGYMNVESKATEKEKHPRESVSFKEPTKLVGNGEIARDDQQSGNADRFPFPLFWLPSKVNEVGKDTEENNVDLVPRNTLTDERKRQTRKNDEGSGSEAESETSSKHVVQKVIPVKQLGRDEEKKIPKRIKTKAKSDFVENTADGTEKKASPKTSKLPPVCLRIDPLPRKKNGSRSPSPPGDKERSKRSFVNDLKSSQQLTQMSEGLKENMKEQSKGNIKTIEVTNVANKVEKDSLVGDGDNVSKGKRNESHKGVVQHQSSECEPCKVKEKKNLSEHDAALIIQSVYRGFEVRKSQPLVKLRQISVVKEQVVELRKRIQDLESSSTTRIDDKQKLIIGETIMSLLLKLDTIQGLHPIVRDIRKSVAKELVGLQEKLDSLTSVKSEAPIEENMSSIEQVIRTEDDAIQEKYDLGQAQSDNDAMLVGSGSILCENHEVKATGSQDHEGAEAHNTNPESQVELNENQLEGLVEKEQPINDALQEKLDQSTTQSDSLDGAKSKDFVDIGGEEAHDINHEQLVEQNTTELNNTQLQMLVEPEQTIEDVIQENSDQPHMKYDNNVETMGSYSDICENHEVETADYQDNGDAEPHDSNLEPLVESETQLSGVEVNNSQRETVKSEQHVEQEKHDQIDARLDTDVENVDSREHPEVETIESENEGNVQTHDIDVSMVESKAELPKEDAVINGIQEDFVVSTEEAPKADDVDSSTEVIMEDHREAPPVALPESQVNDVSDEKSTEDLGRVPSLPLTSSSDKKLMEENEKLRVAMEELMKAGNEQLSVIKELTGRVKDLEKKLSKKKKIKVNNKGRSRGRCVVQEELRDCPV